MSFSVAAKNELARLNNRQTCCQRAELAALIRFLGSMPTEAQSTDDAVFLQIITENAAVARKVLSILKSLSGVRGEVMVRRKTRLRKNIVYYLQIPTQPGIFELLRELGVSLEDQRLPWDLLKRECCRRAYLRGVFLSSGSVNKPEGAYHLEIVVGEKKHAEEIHRLMSRLSLTAKSSKRKGKQVIYLKGSEQIVRFLSIVGAHGALLDFENTRIYKGMRNQVNRIVNCETANLHKTVNASVRQLENIKLVKEMIGFDKIPTALREVAELRAQYPDVSLKELGNLSSIPISKSGINYRLRKIEELAENLRNIEQ